MNDSLNIQMILREPGIDCVADPYTAFYRLDSHEIEYEGKHYHICQRIPEGADPTAKLLATGRLKVTYTIRENRRCTQYCTEVTKSRSQKRAMQSDAYQPKKAPRLSTLPAPPNSPPLLSLNDETILRKSWKFVCDDQEKRSITGPALEMLVPRLESARLVEEVSTISLSSACTDKLPLPISDITDQQWDEFYSKAFAL